MHLLISFSSFTDHPWPLLFALGAVVLAYGVFTLVGFGSALMAGGPLAMVMPVARVIPTLALLDFGGAAVRGWRAHREVAWGEFFRLLPGMLAGQLLGVLVLVRLPARVMAVILGLFIVAQGLGGLAGRKGAGFLFPWPWAQGLLGGVLGGLFGSGGFIYATYLERRLASRSAFRGTQALLIALSTAWRLVLCWGAGLVDRELLLTALALFPALALGVYAGHHLDLRLKREQLVGLLNGLLIASGAGLMLRYLG